MKRYERYKDSGIEWLGKVPLHWEIVPIKYSLLVPLTDGPHETPELVSDGVAFISAEAIKEDKIDFDKKRGNISREDHERFSKKYEPQRGDVYMVKSGATTGNLARVETDAEFNIWSPLAAFRPDPQKTNTDFLFYYMKSKRFFTAIELGWNYGTQQNIGMNVLENLKMVRPPIGEQTAIAQYLDRKTAEIDALITDKKRLLELYEEEKTAIINQAVTKGLNPDAPMKDSGVEWLGEIPAHWEVKRLKYVTHLRSGKNIVSEQIKETGDYPVFGGNGLRGYFSEFTHDGNFVLIGRQGAYCGNIKYGKGKFWASEHAVVVSPLIAYEMIYLGELLRSMNLNQYSVSAAQPGLAVDTIKNLQIPFPPLEEQHSIVRHIETECAGIDAKKAKTEKLIELLTEYRTALISEVVTGKVKVID